MKRKEEEKEKTKKGIFEWDEDCEVRGFEVLTHDSEDSPGRAPINPPNPPRKGSRDCAVVMH